MPPPPNQVSPFQPKGSPDSWTQKCGQECRQYVKLTSLIYIEFAVSRVCNSSNRRLIISQSLPSLSYPRSYTKLTAFCFVALVPLISTKRRVVKLHWKNSTGASQILQLGPISPTLISPRMLIFRALFYYGVSFLQSIFADWLSLPLGRRNECRSMKSHHEHKALNRQEQRFHPYAEEA